MSRRSLLPPSVAALAMTLLLAGCGSTTSDRAAEPRSAQTAAQSSALATDSAPVAVKLPSLPAGVVTVTGTKDALTAAEIRRYAGDGHDVESSYGGNASGFDALCSGRADLVDSSTPITSAELDACHAAGLDVVQFEIAADAVVVAIRNETDIGGDCLSTEQTKDIFRAGSPYTNWSQLGFQDVPLKVGGPDETQDAYRVFDTAVLGSQLPARGDMRFDYRGHGDEDGARTWVTGQPQWQSTADQANGLQVALSKLRSQLAEQRQKVEAAREDLAYARSALAADRQLAASTTQLTSDQKAIFAAQGQIQGAEVWIPRFRRQVGTAQAAYGVAQRAQQQLAGLRGRIAVYGFDYYQVYEEQLRPMEITLPSGQRNCIFPNEQTIMNGQYPLARRTLLTTTTRSLERGEVRDFLTSMLPRVRGDAAAADLVAVDQATLDQQLAWARGTQAPTVLVGAPTASASAAEEVPAR